MRQSYQFSTLEHTTTSWDRNNGKIGILNFIPQITQSTLSAEIVIRDYVWKNRISVSYSPFLGFWQSFISIEVCRDLFLPGVTADSKFMKDPFNFFINSFVNEFVDSSIVNSKMSLLIHQLNLFIHQ